MSDIITRLKCAQGWMRGLGSPDALVIPDATHEIARLREQVRILADECRQRRVMDRLAAYHHVAGSRQEFDDARDAMHAAETATDRARILEAGR